MSPDQILPLVLIAVMLVLAVVLIAVGIQLFLLLKDTRATVRSVNDLVNNVDQKIDLLINPIRTLGSLATGVASGMKAFDTFSLWLKNQKKSK